MLIAHVSKHGTVSLPWFWFNYILKLKALENLSKELTSALILNQNVWKESGKKEALHDKLLFWDTGLAAKILVYLHSEHNRTGRESFEMHNFWLWRKTSSG